MQGFQKNQCRIFITYSSKHVPIDKNKMKKKSFNTMILFFYKVQDCSCHADSSAVCV